jgi:hypothetical protein
MLDNIERIDSDYSTRESRAWYESLEAETIAAEIEEARVQNVMDGIKALGASIIPATLDMLLGSLVVATKHLPMHHAMLDGCASEVECLS